MRGTLVLALSTVLAGDVALAQNPPAADATNNPAANAAASKPTTSTPAPPQPQGPTGPTNTTSGGAPAASPQGDTPSGMQPDPGDPNKDNISPKK
jgi:hypothetical protein